MPDEPIMPRVEIRPMTPDEKPAVRRIAHRAFPVLARLFFSWGQTVLVALSEGRLVGGIVLETFALADGRKVGFVGWVFSDPNARGIGVGQRLIEAALAHFQAVGCHEVLAGVEGHNSSSSKLFATRGFSILPLGAQWQRYRWQLPKVWWRTLHVVDVGHFLWSRPPAADEGHPVTQWWVTLLVNVLMAWIALRAWVVAGWFASVLAAGAVLVLLTVRWAGMRLAARAQGLEVRYRAWESGFPLSLMIALALRGVYPVPGSLYPVGHDWRYREMVPQLGRMALAGVIGPLALLWLAKALASCFPVAQALPSLYAVGFPLLVVDVLTPFFPLACYNGRRIWDWSRPLWAVLAAVVVALIVLA